ncbi:MAG: polysaccharide deacetylase family protein [Muribaculaceae bacterium]|nr:polysaccharide deacetylase family protein [Muribaculaceae bacterium]MDE7096398.1 polysaccharide deacetylase family protein [Muribaculaceae bacterium]
MLLPQERLPWILRFPAFCRDVIFRLDDGKPSVYLTFDDGPIPESTPWLLNILEEYGAKATFFMVADNARRYPELLKAVVDAGHSVGNHTFHHKPPFRQTSEEMMADVALADEVLNSRLFRPPHGLIRKNQQRLLSKEGYRIVMFDLNTLDYRADRTPQQIIDSVSRYVRPGCIINFHDSLKSIDKLKTALPKILSLLRSRNYTLLPLPMQDIN